MGRYRVFPYYHTQPGPVATANGDTGEVVLCRACRASALHFVFAWDKTERDVVTYAAYCTAHLPKKFRDIVVVPEARRHAWDVVTAVRRLRNAARTGLVERDPSGRDQSAVAWVTPKHVALVKRFEFGLGFAAACFAATVLALLIPGAHGVLVRVGALALGCVGLAWAWSAVEEWGAVDGNGVPLNPDGTHGHVP